MAAILVSMSATAVAQCIHPNAPGPPRVWDGARGCYVPQGTPQLGAPVWNGGNPYSYGVPQPAYAQPYGQPYGMPYGGVPAGGGLSNCAVVGGLAGGTLGSLAKHHRGQAVILGALLGGVVGHTVCTNSAGQRVIVQQPAVQTVAPVPQYVQQPAFANPPVPAEQQVGGYAMMNQPVRTSVGQVTFCSVKAVTNGNEVKKTIRVASPSDCEGLGELVEDVRSQDAPVAAKSSKLEESTFPSGGEQDTCRLRINGKPVAEIKLPLSVAKEEAKQICDEWQKREAKSRGLI